MLWWQCGFVNAFVPSSDRSDDDLFCVSESRASVHHDAVWMLGNLRLSGVQNEGGLVGVMICVVYFRYVVGFVGCVQ